MLLALQSCVVVVNEPGPPGFPGLAYFGINYHVYAPYSYWDNNPSIPLNPVFGRYYPTNPGIYEFEYFISETEYWYGTYQTFVNPGGMGGPRGEPGFNGADSYLMLMCDDMGFSEYRTEYTYKNGETAYDKEIVIEENVGDKHYIIKMKKTTVSDRTPQGNQ